MRPPFTDLIRLKKEARRRAEQNTDWLERFYERRYSRPAFSGRFEDRSVAAWQLEMLTDTWRQRTEIQQMIRVQKESGADNAQTRARMRTAYQHLRAIDDVFAGAMPEKTVTEQWDEQFREGKTPDLKSHMAKLKMSDRLSEALRRASAEQARQ